MGAGQYRHAARFANHLSRLCRQGRSEARCAARRTAEGAALMPYTPIVATLGYVLSPDGNDVLMVHRNARPDDHQLGKYNGLGGKIEPDEDVLAGMRREIREEAGIDCTALQLRGTISWPGFGTQGERSEERRVGKERGAGGGPGRR